MKSILMKASIVAGAASVLAGFVFSSGANSQAASTNRLIALSWNGDAFYNYDFLSTSASSSNVDWPITILFTNNASVNRAKSSMENWSNRFDDSSFERMNFAAADNGNWSWDTDGGKKTPACPAVGTSSPHYRVYGFGGNERMYNSTLGYWVPATTHRDYNECPPINKRHAESEQVEDLIISEAYTDTYVANDKFNMYNYEPTRAEGNHYWYNSGYASTVHVP